MHKLTKRVIESAEPKPQPYQIRDNELPGFGVRVFPTGKKSYFLQYRAGNKTRRYTIGNAAVLSLEAARQQATQILSAVRGGADPVGEKIIDRLAPTIADLANRYLKEHCETHVKPSTLAGYKQILRDYILPELGHLKVSEVTRSHIANLHHAHASRRVQANRILEIISKMFNLAELWGWRQDGTNPRRHIKKFKEVKRERYLSPDELRQLGETLNMAEDTRLLSHHAVALFRLLVLTGARLGEIQHCKWEYVNLDRAIISLPDSKTGAKIIPLGRTAIEVLRGIERKPDSPYVICSDIKAGAPINNVQGMWRQIRNWSGLKDVRIHDLRHTFASSAVNIGMSLPIIGKILGHTQAQTTARYAHLAISPAVEAASKVNEQMVGLLALPAPRMLDAQHQAETTEGPKSGPLGRLLEQGITTPTFLSSDEAAAYLNVKPRLMENWRWRKCGPRFVKIGNRIRYAKEALDEFVNNSPIAA